VLVGIPVPGIHTVIERDHARSISESDLGYVLELVDLRLRILYQDAHCLIAISYFEGYPFLEIIAGDAHIVFEGMIYDRSVEDVQTGLEEIARHFAMDQGYTQLVRRFVECSDGDYIVQIWHPSSARFMIFNDYLGRLPLYYHCGEDFCVFSRRINSILHLIRRIQLNRPGLAEFLMFEYPLGWKTIFDDIFRLRPSHMVIVRRDAARLSVELSPSTDFDFGLRDRFSSKLASLDFLANAVTESVTNRVKCFRRGGYRITADLSGGYDTRTVLGLLGKISTDVDYFTFQYPGDEGRFARRVFEATGSPGHYQKLDCEEEARFEIPELIYNTDGLVNYETTVICDRNERCLKAKTGPMTARFMGFGGELIRHPHKLYRSSLLRVCKEGLYSTVPLEVACRTVKLDVNEYKKGLQMYFQSYPEKIPSDQLKRFYYEYYDNYVGAAGENRARRFFWTVQPLWSLKFTSAILSRIPLEWTGYRYYVDFMQAIDARLRRSPIAGSRIRLTSKVWVNLYEVRYRMTNALYVLLKTRVPRLYRLYTWLRYRKEMQNNRQLLAKIRDVYERLTYGEDIFDGATIRADLFSRTRDLKRLLTLLIYLSEVEKRFGFKLRNGLRGQEQDSTTGDRGQDGISGPAGSCAEEYD
jgi:hypothetical protein